MFLKSFITFLSFVLSFVLFSTSANAQAIVSPEDFVGSVISTTFDQMPAFKESGDVAANDPATTSELGFEIGRTWNPGDYPSDVIKLGDIEDGLHAELFTLGELEVLSGLTITDLAVSQLPFLEALTVNDLILDVPLAGGLELPNLSGVLSDYGFPDVFDSVGTLAEIVGNVPEFGELPVMDVLGDLSITDIPGLDITELARFEGIKDQVISNIPGLGDIPLADFPNPLSVMNMVGKQDIAFGATEYSGELPTPDPVSGGTNGTKEWQAISCSGGCAHIELTQRGWEGAQWMTKAHRVKDGYGMLGGLFGEAGAYRLPFGPTFALQVTETDEKEGTADWGIAFRVCSNGFIDLGCTAYFMEVPIGITTKETDTVLTGLRDGKGGSTEPMDAPPELEALRPGLPPELAALIARNTTSSGSGSFRALCGDGPGGIKMEVLAAAFREIESRGSGDYGALGIWVSLSVGETGRGLGKYQYMSYKEEVIAKIGGTPEGAQLLRDARIEHSNITRAQLLAAFPPKAQDEVFSENQIIHIEKAMSRGFEGDELLSVLGQMHLRGPGVLTNGELNSESARDGLGTSVAEYGRQFTKYYRDIEATVPDGDESERCKSTGDYINPSRIGVNTFSRRFSKGMWHPVHGGIKPHDGDDLGTPDRSDIVASDAGVVEWRTQFCKDGISHCGYGWYMLVHHDDGNATLYAHLFERIAPDGARVDRGQLIAKSGGAEFVRGSGTSTGPHLHFEFREGGITPVPPELYVDYNKTVADIKSEQTDASKEEG